MQNPKMRKRQKPMKMKLLWPVLLLFCDLFFIFLVWLASPKAFNSMTFIIVLFTAIILLAGSFFDRRNTNRQIEALERFLTCQDEKTEAELFMSADPAWHTSINSLFQLLREQETSINDAQINLKNYQEFIEEWTHEIKTPLSLSALVLDNHREEMSPYVYRRMQHVQNTVQSHVDRILYYARLQADHVDYRFETICLQECVCECIHNFQNMAEEKEVLVELTLPPLQVVCDKKVLSFMIAQLLSNAFKYTASTEGVIRIFGWTDNQKNGKTHLAIRDNGNGVPPEDLPFLFDKGFTGNHPDRQNATGMGLYLVKKYGEQLSIAVSVEPGSDCGNGFGIRMDFPKVF